MNSVLHVGSFLNQNEIQGVTLIKNTDDVLAETPMMS